VFAHSGVIVLRRSVNNGVASSCVENRLPEVRVQAIQVVASHGLWRGPSCSLVDCTGRRGDRPMEIGCSSNCGVHIDALRDQPNAAPDWVIAKAPVAAWYVSLVLAGDDRFARLLPVPSPFRPPADGNRAATAPVACGRSLKSTDSTESRSSKRHWRSTRAARPQGALSLARPDGSSGTRRGPCSSAACSSR
jgi:hypothetical protein